MPKVNFVDEDTFEISARTPLPERIANYPIYPSATPETPYIPVTDSAPFWETQPTWSSDGYYIPSKRDLTSEELAVVNKINATAVKHQSLELLKSDKSNHTLWHAKNAGKERHNHSYTGVDMVPSLSMPNSKPYIFGDISTLSISTHRESFPVRMLGRSNPIGFTKGPRTIAGSIIFATLDMYPFYTMGKQLFANNNNSPWNDRNVSDYPLGDSLPPFDITITFNNEYDPHGSVLRIFGVILVDDGLTLSVDDLVTENTFSFMAAGYAPLHRARNWKVSTA
jgi:hypothetical protein